MTVIRSPFFIPAVLFLLLAVSFRFDDNGAVWLWHDQRVVAVILLLCSAAMWILLIRGLRNRSGS